MLSSCVCVPSWRATGDPHERAHSLRLARTVNEAGAGDVCEYCRLPQVSQEAAFTSTTSNRGRQAARKRRKLGPGVRQLFLEKKAGRTHARDSKRRKVPIQSRRAMVRSSPTASDSNRPRGTFGNPAHACDRLFFKEQLTQRQGQVFLRCRAALRPRFDVVDVETPPPATLRQTAVLADIHRRGFGPFAPGRQGCDVMRVAGARILGTQRMTDNISTSPSTPSPHAALAGSTCARDSCRSSSSCKRSCRARRQTELPQSRGRFNSTTRTAAWSLSDGTFASCPTVTREHYSRREAGQAFAAFARGAGLRSLDQRALARFIDRVTRGTDAVFPSLVMKRAGTAAKGIANQAEAVARNAPNSKLPPRTARFLPSLFE